MSESVTIIGRSTVINGDIHCQDNLTIEGRVEGAVRVDGVLTIAPGGLLSASVIEVAEAIIGGTVLGPILASELVQIHPGGSVEGDIKARRVVLDEGAVFRGSIAMEGGGEMGRVRSSAHRGGNFASGAVPTVPARPFPPMPDPQNPQMISAQVAARPTVRPPVSRAGFGGPKKNKSPATAKTERRAPAPKSRSLGKSKATMKKRAE